MNDTSTNDEVISESLRRWRRASGTRQLLRWRPPKLGSGSEWCILDPTEEPSLGEYPTDAYSAAIWAVCHNRQERYSSLSGLKRSIKYGGGIDLAVFADKLSDIGDGLGEKLAMMDAGYGPPSRRWLIDELDRLTAELGPSISCSSLQEMASGSSPEATVFADKVIAAMPLWLPRDSRIECTVDTNVWCLLSMGKGIGIDNELTTFRIRFAGYPSLAVMRIMLRTQQHYHSEFESDLHTELYRLSAVSEPLEIIEVYLDEH